MFIYTSINIQLYIQLYTYINNYIHTYTIIYNYIHGYKIILYSYMDVKLFANVYAIYAIIQPVYTTYNSNYIYHEFFLKVTARYMTLHVRFFANHIIFSFSLSGSLLITS